MDVPVAKGLNFCHRRTPSADVYFLNNHSNQDMKECFRFRTQAVSAQLWNPVTGEKTPLSFTTEQGSTVIPLDLHARESFFIVLQHTNDADDMLAAQQASLDQNQKVAKQSVLHFAQPWQVTFDTKMGGPADVQRLSSLEDWTKSANDRIKYFSGTAQYQNVFKVKKDKKASYRLKLNLLNSAAEVVVNGQSAGIIWCSPWDIFSIMACSLSRAPGEQRQY